MKWAELDVPEVMAVPLLSSAKRALGDGEAAPPEAGAAQGLGGAGALGAEGAAGALGPAPPP